MTAYQFRTDEDGSITFAGVTYTYSTFHMMPQNIHKVVVREGSAPGPKPDDPTASAVKTNSLKNDDPNPAPSPQPGSRRDPAEKAEENVVLVMYEHEPVTNQTRESMVAEAVEILMSNGFLQDRRPWSLSQLAGDHES